LSAGTLLIEAAEADWPAEAWERAACGGAAQLANKQEIESRPTNGFNIDGFAFSLSDAKVKLQYLGPEDFGNFVAEK
jgi:hypothetical protein